MNSASSSNTAEAVLIRLDDVHVIYGDVCALDVPAWTVRPGERVFLLGRSGSGKTTLMRVLKNRVQPTTGRAECFGRNVATATNGARRNLQRRVAMVDQEFHLVPRMRVVENVLTGCLGRVGTLRSLLGWYPAAEWAKAEKILREVGLEGLGNRRIETLSGGQRQRAAIARALMQESEIILADEPVSNLDPELAEDALELLVDCVARRNVTLIVSLHQPALAKKFATRLVGLADGQVIFDGPPEELTDAAADRVYRSTLPADMMKPEGIEHDSSTKTVADAPDAPHLRVLER